MTDYRTVLFPKTRIATNDICSVGLTKHHVTALIEVDVTVAREKIKTYKNENRQISFTAWLIRVIALTIKEYGQVAAYLRGKRELIIFNDINVSVVVEKEINGHNVPIPLIIEKANERTAGSITGQLHEAQKKPLTENDIVLHRKSQRLERVYYFLPGIIRRMFWRYLIAHPHTAFRKMGNVAVTSVGMIGNADGWFIPIAVHPVCFGIGRVSKKPVVIDDRIEIRELLKMTVLMDHDVADGGQMARFISKLADNIKNGTEL